jgi:DNA-binding sugar fermentation-stimulating protein
MPILQKCCKHVHEELDPTLVYTESNYQNSLVHYLLQSMPKGTHVMKETTVLYRLSDGFVFGSGRIDILCETSDMCFILELKANVDQQRKYCSRFSGQTSRYVKHFPTTKTKQGILVLFSSCTPILKALP